MRYQYGPMAAVALLRFALAIADVDPGLSARLIGAADRADPGQPRV